MPRKSVFIASKYTWQNLQGYQSSPTITTWPKTDVELLQVSVIDYTVFFPDPRL
jgi:hypothetical protein